MAKIRTPRRVVDRMGRAPLRPSPAEQTVPDLDFRRAVEMAIAPRDSDLSLEEQRWTAALSEALREAEVASDSAEKARAFLTAARAQWHLDDYLGCFRTAMQSLSCKDSHTPVAIVVDAMTLAAFALGQLDLTDEARHLAQRALALARAESLYERLHIALSCSAHAFAQSADWKRAEVLHREALALAQQTGSKEHVQMALDNLFLSFILTLRDHAEPVDEALGSAIEMRASKEIRQVRKLIGDQDLAEWRRLSLRQNLGVFLGLCGKASEAEQILRDCLQTCIAGRNGSSAQSVALSLARHLEALGRPREALDLLQAHANLTRPARRNPRAQRQALRTAESCLRKLGIDAVFVAEMLERQGHQWEAWQQAALACLRESEHVFVYPQA
jgi:hypothetical protein